jgi:excisionase family DNA binding protein
MSTESLLTVQEVAELLGLSVGGVYHMISQKRIPVVKLSARCVRFEKTALDAWIAGMAVPAASVDPTRIPRNKRDDDKRVKKMNR